MRRERKTAGTYNERTLIIKIAAFEILIKFLYAIFINYLYFSFPIKIVRKFINYEISCKLEKQRVSSDAWNGYKSK
ncbi:hypothetical protein JM93_03189 [Roseibium hamelinense]|uniref:Uncharacterized protein n=1 Tax=Roseibium hamelinense TaxID=150831 RepID=A0A562SU89_9HYPH|nr:hypothetical protein JM93_03189 [Roseibium hamelinense]